MGEGRGVETVRVWVNVVTKVAIARTRRRRVALVVRRRARSLEAARGRCCCPLRLRQGLRQGPRRVRWVVRARPMSTAATDRRVPSAAPSKTLPSQTSSQTRGSPARARAEYLPGLRGSSQTMRRPSDQRETPPVHGPPEDTEGLS